ncbi:MAG: hypothetical protein KatS3mg060_2792 [Dehalococcoidia bacterium]|nr:MAG: hypothetical protein KatS3mg060_2792 [Dehalococcoidia bacterium]
MNATLSGRIQFDHTALAAPEKAPILALLRELFGGAIVWDDRTGLEAQGFRAGQLDLSGTVIEVIEPAGEASFLHPYLAKRGPGLHHITFKVAELDRFLADQAARGVAFTGVERDRQGRTVNAFTRPGSSYGMLIQFRPREAWSREALRHHPSLRDLPPPLPSRARLAATAVAAADGAATLAYLQGLLGGELGPRTGQNEHLAQSLRVGGTELTIFWPAEPGPALHHLTLEITDWDETLTAVRRLGLPLRAGEHEAFVDAANPTGAQFHLRRIPASRIERQR